MLPFPQPKPLYTYKKKMTTKKQDATLTFDDKINGDAHKFNNQSFDFLTEKLKRRKNRENPGLLWPSSTKGVGEEGADSNFCGRCNETMSL